MGAAFVASWRALIGPTVRRSAPQAAAAAAAALLAALWAERTCGSGMAHAQPLLRHSATGEVNSPPDYQGKGAGIRIAIYP
eukprot:6113070-Pyramimonas_sp.AAC.1